MNVGSKPIFLTSVVNHRGRGKKHFEHGEARLLHIPRPSPEFSVRRVWLKEQKHHRTGWHRRRLVPSWTKKLRDDAGRMVSGGSGSFHSSGPSSGWASFSCWEQGACILACLSRGCICAGATQRPLVNPSQARRIFLKNSPAEFFSGTGSYVPVWANRYAEKGDPSPASTRSPGSGVRFPWGSWQREERWVPEERPFS